MARPSFGQPTGATGSLERFQPSPAGDALFGVPSPTTSGHLVPRARVVLDSAYHPLSIQEGSTRSAIVAKQLFLHLDASLALFDRLLVSVDMPFALGQSGASPTVLGVHFASPTAAQVGDLRLGARVRLFGGPWDPFQIAAGGYFYAPTAPRASYAGDGAVRGEPQVIVGGRVNRFVYSASLGTTLHASARPHTFDLRAGGAVVLGGELFQIGPELSLSAPFTNPPLVSTKDKTIAFASPTSAELLIGVKVRPLRFLVLGVGAGPGLSQGFGTPTFSAAWSVGYEPLPPRPGEKDTDKDGIPDLQDACPKEPGERSADPNKNGCPAADGVPADADGDGILDSADACPKARGEKSDDPKKNGCPLDTDGDGVPDAEDACPKVPGQKSADPKKNGCPADTDGDGIPDAEDACPDQRGGPDPDPKKNGCSHVTVTKTEIVITRQVQFHVAQATLDQTVDPVSNDLLTEVRDAIVDHPEIKRIEVQGHADNTGPEELNQRLSQGRADAVRLWLVRRGIPSAKLIAKGYGSTVPVAANDTDQGRQSNRRVQFVIIPVKP